MTDDLLTESDLDVSEEAFDREREDCIAGLRALADFLEESPTAQHPSAITVHDYQFNARGIIEQARAIGGTFEKGADEMYFKLVRHFGPHTYQIYTPRAEVCTKRVVGTKKVTRQVPVDEDSYRYHSSALSALPRVDKEVEEDIVEWDCPPSLASLLKLSDGEG